MRVVYFGNHVTVTRMGKCTEHCHTLKESEGWGEQVTNEYTGSAVAMGGGHRLPIMSGQGY